MTSPEDRDTSTRRLRVLTTKQVANLLGVSISHVRHLVQRGMIVAYVERAGYLITVGAIEDYQARRVAELPERLARMRARGKATVRKFGMPDGLKINK